MSPPTAGPSDPRRRRKRGPRGLWNARTASRLPAQDARDTPHNSNFESDDSQPSTPATRNDDPFPIDTEEDQVHYFFDQPDHSRASSPYPKSHWIARTKIIDMSSTARGSHMEIQGPTFDRDDWEDLKDLFSKATELYQSEFCIITQP